jgi:hypothetical protein
MQWVEPWVHVGRMMAVVRKNSLCQLFPVQIFPE